MRREMIKLFARTNSEYSTTQVMDHVLAIRFEHTCGRTSIDMIKLRVSERLVNMVRDGLVTKQRTLAGALYSGTVKVKELYDREQRDIHA